MTITAEVYRGVGTNIGRVLCNLADRIAYEEDCTVMARTARPPLIILKKAVDKTGFVSIFSLYKLIFSKMVFHTTVTNDIFSHEQKEKSKHFRPNIARNNYFFPCWAFILICIFISPSGIKKTRLRNIITKTVNELQIFR